MLNTLRLLLIKLANKTIESARKDFHISEKELETLEKEYSKAMNTLNKVKT